MNWFDEVLYTELSDQGYMQRFKVDRVIYRDQTDLQDLVIFETPYFGRVMALDGVIQTTEGDEYVYHEMIAHVPILAHGAARRVLIIGGGDGGTLREVLRHKSVEQAKMVEIDASVVDVSREHLPSLSAGAFDDPRTDLVIADGCAFVKETDERFDVIIVDSTDPVGPGEVLFTEEFYGDCRRCLTDGGILVTQSGVPFFQRDELSRVSHRLGGVFSDARFYLAVVPTYIGGYMALGFATENSANLTVPVETLKTRYKAAGLNCRYYTPEVHSAAFALPNFIRETANL